jgi:hypothetical protein
MRRRDFITLLGGAALEPSLPWPLAPRAQQPERTRRLSILFGGFSESDPEPRARVEAFRRHLQELGWTDGRNSWRVHALARSYFGVFVKSCGWILPQNEGEASEHR